MSLPLGSFRASFTRLPPLGGTGCSLVVPLPHGWWSDWVPGLPLGPWYLVGGASDGESVLSCLGPRQAVGAV